MNQPFGKGALWAVGGIIVVATVYEVNKRIGLGLFILALMAMALTYATNNPISYERKV